MDHTKVSKIAEAKVASTKLVKCARGNKAWSRKKYELESQNNLTILHILRSGLSTILCQGTAENTDVGQNPPLYWKSWIQGRNLLENNKTFANQPSYLWKRVHMYILRTRGHKEVIEPNFHLLFYKSFPAKV